MSNAHSIRLALMLVAAALLALVIRNFDMQHRKMARLQAQTRQRRRGEATFSPLYMAVRSADIAKVQQLLAKGAKIDEDFHGATPLGNAITGRHPQIVHLLLAHNADPNKKTDGNFPPLEAAIQNLPEVVSDLLAHHADVNEAMGEPLRCALTTLYPDTDTTGRSAIRQKIVRELIDGGASVNPTDVHSNPYFRYFGARIVVTSKGTKRYRIRPFSPLANAICSAPDCVPLLRHAGATLGPDRERILADAIFCQHPELLAPLLAAGANVNGINAQGETALSLALRTTPTAVPLLLSHNADMRNRYRKPDK